MPSTAVDFSVNSYYSVFALADAKSLVPLHFDYTDDGQILSGGYKNIVIPESASANMHSLEDDLRVIVLESHMQVVDAKHAVSNLRAKYLNRLNKKALSLISYDRHFTPEVDSEISLMIAHNITDESIAIIMSINLEKVIKRVSLLRSLIG